MNGLAKQLTTVQFAMDKMQSIDDKVDQNQRNYRLLFLVKFLIENEEILSHYVG